MIEHSAGGVVYMYEGEKLYIQLIHDRFGHVGFAKGKQEAGESYEETALREIQEETGTTGEIITFLRTIHYTYPRKDEPRWNEKFVHYFLVRATQAELHAQEEEISEVRWYEPAHAWKLQLQKGYQGNLQVLTQAYQQLGLNIEEMEE